MRAGFWPIRTVNAEDDCATATRLVVFFCLSVLLFGISKIYLEFQPSTYSVSVYCTVPVRHAALNAASAAWCIGDVKARKLER